jgi:hypothetical protein
MGTSHQYKGLGSRARFDARNLIALLLSTRGEASPVWREPKIWSVAAMARHFHCSEQQVRVHLCLARKLDLRMEIVRVVGSDKPGGGPRGIIAAYHGACLSELSAQRGPERDEFVAIVAGSYERVLLTCTRRVNHGQGIPGTWAGRYL